jgi:putative flippase GtrA
VTKISQVITGNHLLADGFRFILAGGVNTLLTLGIYQLGLVFLPHTLAYATSWFVGILYLLIVYPVKVFPGGTASFKRNVTVVAVYLTVFLVGLWSLERAVEFGLHERLAIFVVLIVSATLNFLLMRLVYRRKGRSSAV